MLFGLLPACAAVLLAVLLRHRYPQRGWLDSILTAALGIAAAAVLLLEGLSALEAISFLPLASIWVIVDASLLCALYRDGVGVPTVRTLRDGLAAVPRSPWAIGGCALALATLAIALSAPPNTWDSMTYHVARVANWHQHGSLAHYATQDLRQLHQAPGAEMLLLHLHALTGGDRLDNCLQWSAFGLASVGALLTARTLGAGRVGARLACAFVLTAPMLILQSTSTQNDVMAAAWIVAFALYGLRWLSNGRRGELVRAGLALGLAILTKSTTFLFAAPFVVWFALATIRRDRSRSVLAALSILGIVLILNAGYFGRNARLYGDPLGPRREEHSTYESGRRSFGSFLSGVTRNLALQLSTPYEPWNRGVTAAVRSAHEAVGVDPDDPETTWPGTSFRVPRSRRHEDSEGSPLHLLLLLGTLLAALAGGRLRPRTLLVYGSCVLLGGALFAFFLRWQPWHARLHVPLWVLAAPCVGVLVGRSRSRRLAGGIMLVLALWALPLVLWGRPRPLLGRRSVFTTPRLEQYFANRPPLQADFAAIARRVERLDVKTIGLRLGPDDWEYPWWVLLGDHARLEHVGVANLSARLTRPQAAAPEAVVCTTAEGRARLNADTTWLRLFACPAAALYVRR